MKMRSLVVPALMSMVVLASGCGHRLFHPTAMPDPEPYMICFRELDIQGTGSVDWEAFSKRFPDTNRNVFDTVDRNGDGVIKHDEWHAFVHAHAKQ